MSQLISSKTTAKATATGAILLTEETVERREGCLVTIYVAKLPACLPEISWYVQVEGKPSVYQYRREGYAKTLRGAKRSVSVAIGKLKRELEKESK